MPYLGFNYCAAVNYPDNQDSKPYNRQSKASWCHEFTNDNRCIYFGPVNFY